ncbi:MAG: DUF1653 domain-containing protein [Lachnospiraceae bacterium]|nr:DUF1653 domain-containing protein [Lachnospiraceae bacterium]
MSNIPLPGQIYRHFKGNLYRIVTMAEHSETGEKLVVYQALYGDYAVYARPLSMFMEKIDQKKYPEAVSGFRFELQKEVIGTLVSGTPQKEVSDDAEDMVKEQTVELESTVRDEEQEELNIDPLVLEFLDAGTYRERLNILAALHNRITDEMINTMAVAADVEIKEGDIEERYNELRTCLLTFEKYECSRLR